MDADYAHVLGSICVVIEGQNADACRRSIIARTHFRFGVAARAADRTLQAEGRRKTRVRQRDRKIQRRVSCAVICDGTGMVPVGESASVVDKGPDQHGADGAVRAHGAGRDDVPEIDSIDCAFEAIATRRPSDLDEVRALIDAGALLNRSISEYRGRA